MNKFPTFKLQGGGFGGFLNPTTIVDSADFIEPGMYIADLGCGSGYFTILLAKAVTDSGKVYAVDIRDSALESVKNKMQIYGVFNIELIKANLEIPGSTGLRQESIDICWLANILFQSRQKAEILKEAQRILKTGGRVAVIDWLPKLNLGPRGHRVSPKEISLLAQNLGLKRESSLEAGRYHYGLIFRK